jgi:hypothetical protein
MLQSGLPDVASPGLPDIASQSFRRWGEVWLPSRRLVRSTRGVFAMCRNSTLSALSAAAFSSKVWVADCDKLLKQCMLQAFNRRMKNF